MHKKNILLVESHYRSRTWFAAIKAGLGGDLSRLYIISVMPEEKKRFLKKGVPSSNILDLNNPVNMPQDREKFLKDIEDLFNINFSLFISMDRSLKKKDEIFIKEYIYQCYTRINTFLDQKNIAIIFFEPTWMHEFIVNALAKIKKIQAYAPATIRIPSNRFLFFNGMEQYKYHLRDFPNENIEVKKIMEAVRNNKKPEYFYIGNLRNKFNLKKIYILQLLIKNFLSKNYNKNIQQNIFKTICKKLVSMLRARYIIFTRYFDHIDFKSEKYVLLTLHVQPEQSIDVLSPLYSNQHELIRLLRLTTPIDCILVIKEHSNAIGDRPLSFYKNIKKISGVKIVSPYLDSHQLIRNAVCIVTNTGTSAFEAAILGKKSITIEHMFFGELLVKPSFNPSREKISDIVNQESAGLDIEKYQKMLSNSFLGDTTDFLTDRNVLKKENIRNLQAAFSEVLAKYIE